MNRTIQVKGLSALGLATAFLIWVFSHMNQNLTPLVFGMLLVAGLQSMGAFWALQRCITKSNVAFFSVFIGDAILRLAGLGFSAYVLVSRGIPYTAPLLFLGTAYLLLSWIQIPFFMRAR